MRSGRMGGTHSITPCSALLPATRLVGYRQSGSSVQNAPSPLRIRERRSLIPVPGIVVHEAGTMWQIFCLLARTGWRPPVRALFRAQSAALS
jgi:hypothetical protein